MMMSARPLSLVPLSLRAVMRGGWGFLLVWRLVTFSLLMIGFWALCLTGEIHPLAVAGFPLLWAAAFFMDRPPAWWREWMTRAIVWLAIVGIGPVAMQGKFVSVLYLLIFLALYKCFSLREAADHLHALVIAFFMFLACSIITSSMVYLVLMLLFLILMVLELICRTIAREGARALGAGFNRQIAQIAQAGQAGQTEQSAPAAGGRQPIFRRLFMSGLGISLLALAMAFGFFLVMPHYSIYRVNAPWLVQTPRASPAAVSGYSDELSLNSIESLKLDDREVMSVILSWQDRKARPFPSGLRLRGLALDQYDETQWMRHGIRQQKSGTWRTINVSVSETFHGPVLVQTIGQNIRMTSRLFGAVMPFRFNLPQPGAEPPPSTLWHERRRRTGPLQVMFDWAAQSVQVVPAVSARSMGHPYGQLNYEALSQWTDENSSLIRSLAIQNAHGTRKAIAPGEGAFAARPDLRMNAGDRAINTQLPPTALTARLTSISRAVASAADVPGKIAQLLLWLNSDFTYSLNPSTPKGSHPIDAFLTVTRKGHCEYFATAFVLLLRAQNIPARVATGFYAADWKLMGNNPVFTVRQSDAHAWAEVWLDGYGWLTLDPTPPDGRGSAARAALQASAMGRWSGLLKGYWQRYVLDYSSQQQGQIMARVRENRFVKQLVWLKDLAVECVRGMPLGKTESASGQRLSDEELFWRSLLLWAAGLLTILLVLQLATRPAAKDDSAPRSPVFFMNTLLERLQALGWKRAESQTPAELIQAVEDQTQGRLSLSWILDIYHRCRFARETPSAEDLARVKETIHNLK